MNKTIFSLTLLCLLPAGTQAAGITLGTNGPLFMNANSTSGTMLVNIVGDGVSIMTEWQFSLAIAPITGIGTLSFNDPASSPGYPTSFNPTNYVFGNDPSAHNVGIAVNNPDPNFANTGLSANDFDTSPGTVVPVGAKNLLPIDFSASANASGIFGIYARYGQTATSWSDPNFQTHLFSNIPDDADLALIGTVDVQGATVPEPSTLTMLGIGSAFLAICFRRRRGTGVMLA